MKRFFILVLTAFIAGHTNAQKSSIFQNNEKAIQGYDVVAFYKDAKPQRGVEQYAYKWSDAIWLFASQAHLDSFKISPERYAPQYSGYCAYGVSQGHKAPTEIDTWAITDGKLYFNYNQKVKQLWTKNTSNYISLADKTWIEIKDKD